MTTNDFAEDYRPAPGDLVTGTSVTGKPVNGRVVRLEPKTYSAPVAIVEQLSGDGSRAVQRAAYPRDLRPVAVQAGVTEGLYCSRCGAPVADCEPCGNGCTFPVPA